MSLLWQTKRRYIERLNRYANTICQVFGTSLLAYWPLDDPPGSTIAREYLKPSQSGYHFGTVIPGVSGIDAWRTATQYSNNLTSYGVSVLYGDAWAAAFDATQAGRHFTIMGWVQAGASSVFSDGSNHRAWVLPYADLNNRLILQSGTNTMNAVYVAGGVTVSVSVSFNALTMNHWAITVDRDAGASGEFKFYLNGVQQGATQTGLGTWSGNIVGLTTLQTVGATNLSLGVTSWRGVIQRVALSNRALTAAQIAVCAAA